MSIDRSTEILDLRKDGLDCYQIARKLELTVPEVENVVYGQVKDLSPDMIEYLHWGQHY